jgi:glycosyltransferase involved in cell wall biosynthesis
MMEVVMKNNVFGEINLEDNLVIIGPSYMKKEILNECNLKYNIKFFNIEELKEKYLYKYKDSTLVYLDTKYNLIPEVGKIILSYLYEIDTNNTYSTLKLNNLVTIKKDLIASGHIIYDNNFKKYLNNKKVLVLNDGFNSLTENIISKISIYNNTSIITSKDSNKEELTIYEFNTLEEEVIFLATKISELIKDGITGFILSDNSPDTISNKIYGTIGHIDDNAIVENARKMVEEKYSYDSAVNRFKIELDAVK